MRESEFWSWLRRLVSTGRDTVRVKAAFEAERLEPGMDVVRRMGVAVTACDEATVRESVRTRRGCNVLAGSPAAARRLAQPAGLAQRAAALARVYEAGVRVDAAVRQRRVGAVSEALSKGAG